MTRLRQLCCAALLAGQLLTSASASAMPEDPEATEQLELGERAYKAEKYDEAIEAFKAGFDIERDPAFLYAWAQAERQNGNCREAVRLYTRFIDTEPPELAAAYAKDGIVRCAGSLADEPQGEPAGEDASPGPAAVDDAFVAETLPDDDTLLKPQQRDVGTDDATGRWYQDRLGGVLVGVGGGVALVGGGLLVGAEVDRRRKGDYGEFEARVVRVRRLRIAGGATLGVGVAILAGGFVRWAVLGSRERKARRAELGALLDAGSVGLTLRGRF